MEAKGRKVLEALRADASERHPFDELTKGLASGTISRGRAMKLAGAGLLAALFGSVATEEAEAATDRVCRNTPAISNRRCPAAESVCRRREGQICQCAVTVEGDRRCVDTTDTDCPTRDECDRSSDCRRGEVCIEVGACCEGSRRNLCVTRCS